MEMREERIKRATSPEYIAKMRAHFMSVLEIPESFQTKAKKHAEQDEQQ